MSYDLQLFRADKGEKDLEAACERACEEELGKKNKAPDPAKEKRKRELARALVKRFPDLKVFPEGALDEPKGTLKRVSIELTSEKDWLQISLFDDTGAVTVPYWHGGAKAEPVAKRMWDLLKLLQTEGGFHVFDPQIGKVLDLANKKDLQQLAEGVGFSPPF